MIDLEPALVRVQCKLAKRIGGALVVRLQTSRYTPRGYVTTSYTASEVDLIGIYSPELAECYLVPIEVAADRRALYLRLDPPGNNQVLGIRWARDFIFADIVARLLGSPQTQAAQLDC